MPDARDVIDFVNDESNKYRLIITVLGRMEVDDYKEYRYRERLIECFSRDRDRLIKLSEDNNIQMSIDEIDYSEKEINYYFSKIEPKVREIFELLRLIDRANATILRRTTFTPDTEYLDEDPESWVIDYLDQ
jgi:hypothetical protein